MKANNKENKSSDLGEQLLYKLGDIDQDLIEETKFFTDIRDYVTVPFKNRHRRFKITVIAAVLVFALGITSFAISKNQWNIDIINYMGISNADTSQLADGTVEINEIDKKNVINLVSGAEEEIWVNAESSIGDKLNAYIRIKSNITLPESLKDLPGYFMADLWQMTISDKKEDYLGKSWGGSIEAIMEDDGLVFMVNLQDVEDLNTSYITLTIGNIEYCIDWDEVTEQASADAEIYYSDYVKDLKAKGVEEIIIYEDSWTMDWKYSYKSPEISKNINEKFEIEDLTCIITKIQVTPLEVSLSGHVAYTDWKKDIPKDAFHMEKIVMRDGSEILLDEHTGTSHGRGIKNMIPTYYFSMYENIAIYNTALNPKEVKSVFVNGQEITVN